jgi:pimeloyl-ACP methyl ester carboxylesterase
MSLPLGPLGPPQGGQDPGPQRQGRQQEITLDRRVAGAIEALEFLGRHLRTDKVVLVAESMGTLTEASLVKRRPDRWDLGPGTRTWPGRSEPTCLRRTWTAGCPSPAWRSALPQRQGGAVGGG